MNWRTLLSITVLTVATVASAMDEHEEQTVDQATINYRLEGIEKFPTYWKSFYTFVERTTGLVATLNQNKVASKYVADDSQAEFNHRLQNNGFQASLTNWDEEFDRGAQHKTQDHFLQETHSISTTLATANKTLNKVAVAHLKQLTDILNHTAFEKYIQAGQRYRIPGTLPEAVKSGNLGHVKNILNGWSFDLKAANLLPKVEAKL